jgi:hypothetical protein
MRRAQPFGAARFSPQLPRSFRERFFIQRQFLRAGQAG